MTSVTREALSGVLIHVLSFLPPLRMTEIAAYNLEVLVCDVREVIDALGYGPQEDGQEGRGCVLVGHDWGGTVAWTAAHVLGPSRIKGLCVMNCPHPKVYMEQATMAQFFKSWYFYCA